ncbi:uncharacterized protein LOC127870843 isoform X1 [Dreissena polymorpha]|uniref:Uncharacterized protein n=1 Tax=Dreissena polymorpha TaxID=45954 RepID=A0A9D4LA98_DREPO|nr:uncharacterized protein LOC127870843 isoform X1 [Dreissena polymorpha]KAH3854887.1 hypothetical protein DPMN_097446 [Dreissena polymorpha]
MEDETIESLSIKLCTVLDDIGVTEKLINFRRYVCTLREVYFASLNDHNKAVLHTFGSQMEGSTTLGMRSDLDNLCQATWMTAYTELKDCRQTNIDSFLAIKTTTLCPQFYSLQYVMQLPGNILFPARKESCEFLLLELPIIGCMFMLDEEDRVVLSNQIYLNSCFQDMILVHPNDKYHQHGPAQNLNDNEDYVDAVQCPNLPVECQVLFSRPKPGHWPKKVTITKAKECGVFFIYPGNIGHTFTYNVERSMVLMNVNYQRNIASRQFIVSTNKIELLLMCDLNIVQMKAYILTKMIRKQFLKPIVGDQLSTFHVKTALLFTVEKYPMEIWNTENLVNCVLFSAFSAKTILSTLYHCRC